MDFCQELIYVDKDGREFSFFVFKDFLYDYFLCTEDELITAILCLKNKDILNIYKLAKKVGAIYRCGYLT